MSDRPIPHLANSGPMAMEVMRTVPLGRLCAVRPRAALRWWLEQQEYRSHEEPRRYEDWVHCASPSIIDTLGLRWPSLKRPVELQRSMWEDLRERHALPVLNGLVVTPPADASDDGTWTDALWAPLHPWLQATPEAQATAAAAALLFPAVIARPVLLWRRPPRLRSVRMHDGFAVQLLGHAGGPHA